MLKKYHLMVLVAACFLLQSCTSSIVKFAWGAKLPNVENEVSLTTWLKNEHVKYDYVYAARPENFYRYCIDYFDTGLLFYGDGHFKQQIPIKGKQCLETTTDILEKIKPLMATNDLHPKSPTSWQKIEPIKTLKELEVLQTYLYTLRGEKSNYWPDNTYDYILFLPATAYLGSKIQTKDLRSFIKAAKSNPQSKIQIILLNFDKQEWWGKEWCDKINITI